MSAHPWAALRAAFLGVLGQSSPAERSIRFIAGGNATGQLTNLLDTALPAEVSLSYAGRITWNLDSTPQASVTLTGAASIALSGGTAGGRYRLAAIQGGSGNNTIAFENVSLMQGSPTATALGNQDVFEVVVVGSDYCVFQKPKAPAPLGFSVGVRLAGMDFSTSSWQDFVPTNTTLAYYASKNVLSWNRLSFYWESMQPTLGGSLNSTMQSAIATVASNAASNGQTVILDLHNYGQYNGVNIGASGGPTIAQFANFWQQMSTYFKGKSGIGGYELMNEPHIEDNITWPAAAQAAVTAIRSNGDDTMVLVDGDGWAASESWPTYNNSLWISDPANNVVYSAHGYADDNSGTYANTYQTANGGSSSSPALMIGRIEPFVNWCEANGARGYFGEFGVPWFAPDNSDDASYDPRWLSVLDQTLAYLQRAGMPVTLQAGGGYWSKTYPQRLDPIDFLPATGSSGSQTLPSSETVDAPQWAVISRFTGANQPGEYYASGPATGTHGEQSSAFTVQYEGILSSPVTIALSDGGQSGTFTPSSLVLPAGVWNPAANFTYENASAGTYSLSFTSSGVLTAAGALSDPPSFSFVAS